MKYKQWYIARGNLSAKECLDDIMNNFKIDNYTTKVSFVNIEKKFKTIIEAKKFDKEFIKWCWEGAGNWHNEADCTVGGIQKQIDGEWEDIEEIEVD